MTTPHVFCMEGTAHSVAAVRPDGSDRYDLVLKDEDTGGRFSLVDMVLDPTFDSSPGHSHHEHSETFYVIAGQIEWIVEDEARLMGPGDLVFIPPYAHHIARAVGDEQVRMLMIWEPAGWEVGMIESAGLTAEQRADEEFMADFRLRNDTYL